MAVRARGWGWRHATRAAWAVRGVDLDVAPGERVLLLGASGCGKSTVLAGLAGLLDPGPDGTGEAEGTLLIDDKDARQARFEAIDAGRARTGLLLQDPLAQTVLARCGDDVAFGLENHRVDPGEIWPRVSAALSGVGFPYPVAHPTSRLSGGERQRLALAGVLALRPGLLLLDEPTAMLDPDGARLLRDQMAAVLAATGATCLLVEHRVAPWLPLVDRVVVLAAGEGVVADGSPEQVLDRRGAALAAQGVWVPGHPPTLPRSSSPAGSSRSVNPSPSSWPSSSPSSWPRPVPSGPVVGSTGGSVVGSTGGEELLVADSVAVRRAGLARPAVAGVDLSLVAGRSTCVVGPNGSGKSSLALALSGLVAPAAGQVRAARSLRGNARSPFPIGWPARTLVTRIGTVFQEPQHQFVARTCAEELAVGPTRTGVSAAETARRVAELLDVLRLAPLARANPFTLSGGEQRRLSVATALATRPPVLILDEPTFGQDARTWAEVVVLLRDLLADGSAVLTVTHDEALVDALSGDVLRLRDGRPADSLSAHPLSARPLSAHPLSTAAEPSGR